MLVGLLTCQTDVSSTTDNVYLLLLLKQQQREPPNQQLMLLKVEAQVEMILKIAISGNCLRLFPRKLGILYAGSRCNNARANKEILPLDTLELIDYRGCLRKNLHVSL